MDVPVAQSGQGFGTQSTARQVGSALGIAVLGTILFTTLGTRLETALEAMAQLPDAARASALSAAAFLVVRFLASLSLGQSKEPKHANAEDNELDVDPDVRPRRAATN